MVRIALIGAGYMGRRHAAAYAGMHGVEVVAVAGHGGERARRLASELGARAPGTWEDVLAEARLDAVDVTFPTARHAEVAHAAIEAGVNVFCETPLTASPVDAAPLVDSARRRGVHLQVALLTRFAKPWVRVHELVRGGALGPLRGISARRLAPGTGGAHHGDAFEELMLFDLDGLLWTLGPPPWVSATSARGPTGRIDHAIAALGFRGTAASAEASYLVPPGHPFTTTLSAFGEDASVEALFRAGADGPPHTCVTVRRPGGAIEEDPTNGPDPVVLECEHFVRVLRGEADPRLLDGEAALASLRVLAALRESAEGDGPVRPLQ